MLTYKVKVINEGYLGGVVTDAIYIVLVGVNCETVKHQLHLAWKNFLPDDDKEYEFPSDEDLGEVLLVRLYKERSLCLPESPWYCGKVTVISPSGVAYHFPYYQWLVGSVVREIQEGKGIILSGDPNPLIVKQRRTELEEKRKSHRWKVYCAGAPHCIDEDGILFIIRNDQYSLAKHTLFLLNKESLKVEMLMEGYRRCTKSWTNLTDIKKIFSNQRTVTSDLVSGLWKEDTFFGYQYLNGVNPVIIKKCTKIPDNFPVSEEMVSASLSASTALRTELQDGNIFLADYEILLDVAPNTINGQLQYIAAPMCLLWKTPQNDIIPIAIQLGQTPGEDTPIFLPSDTEWDWTLAKMWVRNADLLVHEGFFHLLYTHLLAEVFHVATTRQLPVGHPVYKLIIQHLHYTLDVNVQARKSLIAPGGTIDMFSGCGSAGVNVLLRKGLERMTYTSLCLPDDIEFRGVQSVPNYFYRDDGMSIWSAIERFVSDIVHYYYENDEAVCEDPELQAWVEEIYKEGFLEYKDSGIPSSLETQGDLTRYLTMVIFTCSVRHAAVNSGQFDFYSWMPNSPSSMRCPPPARKGTVTLQSVLDTMPQVNTTAVCLATMLLLSVDPLDKVCDLQPRFLQRRLGRYPEEHFTEDMPKKFIQDFQRELAEISRQIKERNVGRSLTYLYLDPENIENSVAI